MPQLGTSDQVASYGFNLEGSSINTASFGYIDEQENVWAESEYYNLTVKSQTGQLKNVINVIGQNYTLESLADQVYDSDEVFEVSAGGTVSVTIKWSDIPVKPDTVEIILINVLFQSSIDSFEAYAWGAVVNVSGPTGAGFTLLANGKKYIKQDGVEYTAKDTDSIREYDEKTFVLKDNQLIQNLETCQQIAENLLSSYKDIRKDAVIEKPCTALYGLSDSVKVVEYKDDLITTVNSFWIIKNNIKFNGAIDCTIELKRVSSGPQRTY